MGSSKSYWAHLITVPNGPLDSGFNPAGVASCLTCAFIYMMVTSTGPVDYGAFVV